jgi:hypothetical protein
MSSRETTEGLIAGRALTHGSLAENSKYMQAAKVLMRGQPNWNNEMKDFQRESLDMIQHKIGRILHGDPDYLDHWDDIAGYAQRVASILRETQ